MGEQRTFGSMAWNHKGKVTRQRAVPGRDGCGDSVGAVDGGDRAALPQGGSGPPAAGAGEDAAVSTSCSSGSICPTRRPKTRSTTASRCGASPGWSWAMTWCPTRRRFCGFVTCWRSIWADERHLRGDSGTAGREAAVAAIGDDRGRDHHRGTELDEERHADPRSGDEADVEGQELALRDEAARRDGCLRGLVHTVRATHAGAADITQLPELLHGQEREVFGDQAYWKQADRQAYEARGVRYRMNRRLQAPSSR